jgi:hypothetical protein
MGGKGSPPPPAPIDPGQSMGEYLFGSDFASRGRGITDPVLQQRLLDAERTFRPQYTALELADIGTMARGLEEREVADPRFAQTQDRISQLQAELAQTPETIDRTVKFGRGQTRTVQEANPRRAELERAIASQQETLAGLSPTMIQESTPGLFDLLEEQSTRAGRLQREQLELQREADVSALQRFAPQVVEAYRAADPASTAIAERMSRRALGQLTPEEERNIQQRSRQASLARGRIGDSSSLAAEALGRSDYTAQFAQPAFAMNRALAGDIGSTLLGRPSSSIGLGGQLLGQAQQGAAGPVGPQLFDPNVGINLALQQRGQDVTFQGMQAQADATRSAGIAQGVGNLFCWVAREVYGIENPKWLQFRYWMLNDAPSWFRNLYIKYGERIAKFISNKPRIKSIIRKWMNTKIK